MSFVNKKLEEFNEYIRFRKVAVITRIFIRKKSTSNSI